MTKIELIHGDCMEGMKDTPDNFWDLAIPDPPYGIGDINQTKSRIIYSKIKWNNDIPGQEYFTQLYRVSKNQIIWGCNYYGKYIKDTGRIIHDKTNGGRTNIFKELSDVDLASHSFGVNMKIFRYGWAGNVQGQKINWDNTGTDARIHPTQKPVALYKWLLKNYAKEGDKILDTHGGSFGLIIACIEMGFDATTYEIDKDYFDAAVKRVKNHVAQLDAFIKPSEITIK